MKLAIIGTSNSIGPRTYVQGIQGFDGNIIIQNFSLGHSTSVAAPFHKLRIDFSDFDYCIIDFSVNDEMICGSAKDIINVKLQLDFLLQGCLGTNCIPVILVMPTIRGIGKILPVHHFYIDYAHERRYLLFDGFKFFERLMSGINDGLKPRPSRTASEFFRDSDHVSPWVAMALGYSLAEVLDGGASSNVVDECVEIDGSEFIYADLTRPEYKLPTITRESSLISQDFVKITDEPVELDVPAGLMLIGVGINLAQSSGAIDITSGQKTISLDYSDRYIRKDGKPVFVIRQLSANREMRVEDGKLSIRAVSVGDREASVELQGLVLRGGAQTLLVRKLDVHVDLVEAVPRKNYELVALVGLQTLIAVDQAKPSLQ